jgi:hypothetical protein
MEEAKRRIAWETEELKVFDENSKRIHEFRSTSVCLSSISHTNHDSLQSSSTTKSSPQSQSNPQTSPLVHPPILPPSKLPQNHHLFSPNFNHFSMSPNPYFHELFSFLSIPMSFL